MGNVLDVTGNHIELDASSTKKAERFLNNKVGEGTETVWASVLLDGSSTSDMNNISLDSGLWIGQGSNSSGDDTLTLYDQDGLVGDTGLSASGLNFLVLRVDFADGDDEFAYLWVNPLLDAVPDTGDADASGDIKEFSFDFLRLQLEEDTDVGIDELRLGSTAAEVMPHTPVPEPGTLALLALGLTTLAVAGRRR
ncbi:MAG: PEP-CTERM sorting domain-containing protein [Deltaproteobacteria bacterium]|nr:PEP-CTERM sorting domain-containing protein [Deltaproteobacteria bacterium]MBW2362239.1 PEP-CTERM sorting domain-containing protein [Deltaproteobacteria bacterium]